MMNYLSKEETVSTELVNEEDQGEDEKYVQESSECGPAVGLIGHFEAKELLLQRGRLGSFMGSLDMGMSKQELVSLEDGVGEREDVTNKG
ncbi:unnamed protein product [Choristocarpus tenellus]